MRRRDGGEGGVGGVGDGDGDGEGGFGGGFRELAAADDWSGGFLELAADPRSFREDFPCLLLDECPSRLSALRYSAIFCITVSVWEPFPDALVGLLS